MTNQEAQQELIDYIHETIRDICNTCKDEDVMKHIANFLMSLEPLNTKQ